MRISLMTRRKRTDHDAHRIIVDEEEEEDNVPRVAIHSAYKIVCNLVDKITTIVISVKIL